MDAYFAPAPAADPGKQGGACGQEAAVADTRAVDMGVRSDENVVADDRRMPRGRV